MKRSTARLINAVAYRRALARDLPDLEAGLLAVLEEGQTLRTRRWIARKEGESLSITPNDSPLAFRQIPLEMPRARSP